MSGGSLDYVYIKVDDAADAISERASTTLQRAFAAHLKLVAAALKKLEWVYSSDLSPGDEEEAIRAVVSPDSILAAVAAEAAGALPEAKAPAAGRL